MMAVNKLSSLDNRKFVRYQARYQLGGILNTDTVSYDDNPLETLVESQREGKHGIKNNQSLDTVFNTVFYVRMSMNLPGLHRTLKARKPSITGVVRDGI
jgi:hypothetical protein